MLENTGLSINRTGSLPDRIDSQNDKESETEDTPWVEEFTVDKRVTDAERQPIAEKTSLLHTTRERF
jgi:hypothetical protein